MGPHSMPERISFDAKPYAFSFPSRRTALLLIDMQRDFLLDKGFGDIQGGNLSAVKASIEPTKQLLSLCRRIGLPIFFAREGHRPDMADCPASKLIRQAAMPGNAQHQYIIGEKGPLGRLLVRGEWGHDIVDELVPLPGEIVVDKPGKGIFWNTNVMHKLKMRGITHLIVGGVTTECCFATSVREANDRGFECCGISDATAGYNDDFKCSSLEMIFWSQGLLGFVADLKPFADAIAPYVLPEMTSDTPPLTPPAWDGSLDIASLRTAYRSGLSPITVIEKLYKDIEAYETYHGGNAGVWIHLEKKEEVLNAAKNLMAKYPDTTALPPLFGIPFSIKDSLDVAGLSTTTACPPLAYMATISSPVYDACVANGALFIGKTNLDQLATGLSGCRSPYGMPHSVFSADYISGGSSSGNAVSVGAHLVSFSVATDTAGSGRVPSAFNGVVGYKPTRGLLSTVGLVPACLSLDCIALIAHTVSDVRYLMNTCEAYDRRDRYAKDPLASHDRHVDSIGPQAGTFKFGIPPPEALAICSKPYLRMFNAAIAKLQKIGGILTPCDYSPFEKAGKLLYDGTFVSERLASLPDNWLATNKDHLHPVIAELFSAVEARSSTAIEAYRDLQMKSLYTRQAEEVFGYAKEGIDVLVVPSTPTHWKTEEVLADPIKKNSILGEFTHCGNVLDLCAIAVPAGVYPVSELSGNEKDVGELPFSITFLSGVGWTQRCLKLP